MTDIQREVGTCERCWGKAFTAAYGIGSKTQAGEYERIVASCACTSAQKRGVADSFAEGYAARDKEIARLHVLIELRDAVIATLRTRVKELEAMAPRWVPVAQKIALDIQGWLPIDDQKCGDSERQWLMVPPIPLPGDVK